MQAGNSRCQSELRRSTIPRTLSFASHCNGNFILGYHCMRMIDSEEAPGLLSTSGLCHLPIDLKVDRYQQRVCSSPLSAHCVRLYGYLFRVQDVRHLPLPMLLLLALRKWPQPVPSYIVSSWCEAKDLAMLAVLPMTCWCSVRDVSELKVGFM
jgi:hypothetical protein